MPPRLNAVKWTIEIKSWLLFWITIEPARPAAGIIVDAADDLAARHHMVYITANSDRREAGLLGEDPAAALYADRCESDSACPPASPWGSDAPPGRR